ncbi:MAG: exonuclease domain-containing protein [Pseudomonadota bacterium]|nr:exonuclease domain-containing protein [Pseudomonadota bacterium]
MNYVIYDFESSGVQAKYAHPIQFAAALTDENFNILETFNERCRLRDGVVPDPGSLLITKATIDSLKNEQSYYDFMKKIYDKLQSWSPAIFFGYNNIVFDDEVLRQNFYQTLLNPYLNTSNQNTRIDIWRVVIALAPLELGVIDIPKDSQGKNITKLETISKKNNIEHVSAHDALSDVKATLGLAKTIQEKEPVFWENCLQSRSPKTLSEYLCTDEYFYRAPQARSSVKYTPVSFITSNPNKEKELAFFNLSIKDYEKEIEKRSSAISSIIKKKTILIEKSHRFPILLSQDYFKNTDLYKNTANGVSYKEIAKKIKSSENFIENVKQSLVDQWEEFETSRKSTDTLPLEEQIYGSMPLSRDDQDKINEFNNSADPFMKLKASKHIDDTRYRQHANRILYEEYPSELTDKERQKYQKSLAERALSKEEGISWMTIPKAKEIIESLKNDEKYQKETDYINEIEDHINSEEKRYKKYLGD